jgi:hypothetical protein
MSDFWGFEDPSQFDQIRQMVEENPYGYVLKPQREGGNNNIYQGEIVKALQREKREDLQQYILMRRIEAIPYLTVTVRNRKMDVIKAISELGIFGYYISNRSEGIMFNSAGGYLLRTKIDQADEGGIISGYAHSDTFYCV